MSLETELRRYDDLAEERTANMRRRIDHSTTSRAWVRIGERDGELLRQIVALGERIKRTYGISPERRPRG